MIRRSVCLATICGAPKATLAVGIAPKRWSIKCGNAMETDFLCGKPLKKHWIFSRAVVNSIAL